MTRPPLLVVEWGDAVASTGWQAIGAGDPPDACVTVGFLDTETDDFLTLAGTLGDEQTNNRMTIPKGWIKNRKELKL